MDTDRYLFWSASLQYIYVGIYILIYNMFNEACCQRQPLRKPSPQGWNNVRNVSLADSDKLGKSKRNDTINTNPSKKGGWNSGFKSKGMLKMDQLHV